MILLFSQFLSRERIMAQGETLLARGQYQRDCEATAVIGTAMLDISQVECEYRSLPDHGESFRPHDGRLLLRITRNKCPTMRWLSGEPFRITWLSRSDALKPNTEYRIDFVRATFYPMSYFVVCYDESGNYLGSLLLTWLT